MRLVTVTAVCATSLLLVSGCASNAGGSGASGSAASSATSGGVSPTSSATFDAGKFQQALDTSRTALGFPGVIAGVWAPTGEWVGTSGTSGQGLTTPITPAFHTRIGSISKTFTVTALLQLFEQGKVSLDDTIGKYVPGVPNANTATLANLAEMTSGIPSYTLNDSFTKAYFANPAETFTPEQLINVIRNEPASFVPGAKYDYSNSNTVLLGMVIEKVTGEPMSEVLKQQIFTPLGLTGTSFPGTSPDLPNPYLSGITEQGQPQGKTANATNWNPSWAFTAGEMISTLSDLRIWGKALATGEGILGKEMAAKRLASLNTTVAPNTAEKAYGLGFGRINDWIGHTGELPGYNTTVYYDPNLDTTVVVMVNSDIASASGENPASAVTLQLMQILEGGSASVASSGQPSVGPSVRRHRR